MNSPKLTIIENFIENPDDLFLHLCENVDWDERLKARKTASFGFSYDYSGMTYPQTTMLPEFEAICTKIEGEIGFLPNNCLLNFYPDGKSSMGYHSDSSEELLPGTGVVTISLGAERHISYRSKADKGHKVKYLLKKGALLYMDNEVQQNWMHAIPKVPETGARISLTFRNILN